MRRRVSSVWRGRRSSARCPSHGLITDSRFVGQPQHSFLHASHLKQLQPVVRLYWVDFTVALPFALSVNASSSPSNPWRFFASLSQNCSTGGSSGMLSSYIRHIDCPPLHSLTRLTLGFRTFRFSYSPCSHCLVSGVNMSSPPHKFWASTNDW
jgi:hypothetical protein